MDLVRDLRYAARTLLSRPGFTLVVVLTLALGIGANAAVFSVVDALILRPFPIPDLKRLVMIWETVPARGVTRSPVAPANYLDWKQQSGALEDLVAFEWWDVNLTGGALSPPAVGGSPEPTRDGGGAPSHAGKAAPTTNSGADEPERVQGTRVSPGFLRLLGVRPPLGRNLVEQYDPQEQKTVVLSYALWSRRFGSRAAIIGETVLLDGEPHRIVGIAPAGFDYPYGSELWSPLNFDPETAAIRDRRYLDVIGRMKENRTVGDVRTEFGLVARRLEEEHPATNRGRGVHVMELGRAVVDEGAPAVLTVWQSAVAFVLLIACVNVANLMLARGSDRERELSLRFALGASRLRVLRQLMAENLLVSGLGALVSLPLAWLAIELLRSNMPATIRRFVVGWDQIDLDSHVVLVTAVTAVITSLLFGLLPALSTSRRELTGALKGGGRFGTDAASGRGRRSLLVVAEIALALTLLVASGLSVRGLMRMLDASHGYDREKVMTVGIVLPEQKYVEPSRRHRFYADLLESIDGLPGVVSAGATSVLPSLGGGSSRSFEVEGRPAPTEAERPVADSRVVSPKYFETMRIPLISGRSFGREDESGALPVAVVSEKMARQFWPDSAALGMRFRVGAGDDAPWLTVVGVVGDVVQNWFMGAPPPTFYRPMAQQPVSGMRLVVRTSGEPTAITHAIQAEVRRVDPDQPVFDPRSMKQVVSDRVVGPRYAAVVMSVLGILALALAAVGIYGVMAYNVSRRTREIGVRVALGARRRDVLLLVLSGTLRITALGVAAGLLLALGAGKLMASTLFGTVSLDATTFLVFSIVLVGVSLFAGYVPARRALAVDAAVALRVE